MSNEKYSIEEVFKSELEDFEVDVPQNAWSNISQNIPNSIGSSVATKVSLMSTKTLLVAAVSLLTIATVSLISITQKNKQEPKPTANNTPQTEINNPRAETKNEVITIKEEEKTSSPIEDPVIVKHKKNSNKKENKQYVIKTTKDSKSSHSQNPLDEKASNKVITPKEEVITSTNPTTKDIEIIEVEKTELMTSISASPIGGSAPLVVEFSHSTNTPESIWKIDNEEFSRKNKTSHTFDKAGQYEVTLEIIDKEGNTAFDSKIITVTPTSSITNIPNIFSPNNDLINDNFIVKYKNISSFSLYIYNNKSELIFETQDIEKGWNGENKYGEEANPGDYIYIIRAEGIDGNKFEEKGIIKLVR